LAGFLRFSLAAATVGMMKFSDSRMHRKIVLEVEFLLFVFVPLGRGCACVMQVACLAQSEGQSPLVGVLYDEILRKKWEDLSAKKHSFSPGDQVNVIHDESQRRAVALWNTFFKKAKDDTAEKTSVDKGNDFSRRTDKRKRRDEEVCLVVRACMHAQSVVELMQVSYSRKVWSAQPQTPPAEPANKKPKTGTCYLCHKPGHFAFECPDKKPSHKRVKGEGKGKQK
jgi:hypothetical protein